MNEGRASSESFNVSYYLANNADLRAAGFNNQQAQQHFKLYGFQEVRLGAPSGQVPVGTDPGAILGNAFNLGVLNGDRSVMEFIGSSDRDDYYRFTLARTSNFNLSLTGLSTDTNVQLIYDSNANGQVDDFDTLRQANGGINANASINSALGAGTYFIRVNVSDQVTSDTNYNLGVSAIAMLPTTPTAPGNTLSTALDIGTLSSSTSFNDFIGSVDRNDFYRFTLANNSNFNLSVNGLKDDAKAELISDSNGNGQYEAAERLYSTDGNEFSSGSIVTNLVAGNYFVRLNAPTSNNTNYTLSLSV